MSDEKLDALTETLGALSLKIDSRLAALEAQGDDEGKPDDAPPIDIAKASRALSQMPHTEREKKLADIAVTHRLSVADQGALSKAVEGRLDPRQSYRERQASAVSRAMDAAGIGVNFPTAVQEEKDDGPSEQERLLAMAGIH